MNTQAHTTTEQPDRRGRRTTALEHAVRTVTGLSTSARLFLAVLSTVGLLLTAGVAAAPPAAALLPTSCQPYGPKLPGNTAIPAGLLCQTVHVSRTGAGSTATSVDISFGQNRLDECGYWVDFDLYDANSSRAIWHSQGTQLPCQGTVVNPFSLHRGLGWYTGGRRTLKGCSTLFRNDLGTISTITRTCAAWTR